MPEEQRPLPHLLGQLARPARATTRRCKDVVDLVLQVNAGYYAMEQANPRHEHEWRVWEDVKLPEGKMLIPGVVTHHTDDRRAPRAGRRSASCASPNVVGRRTSWPAPTAASRRAAFVQRVHPEVQWAKLEALAEGARLASRELWGSAAAA